MPEGAGSAQNKPPSLLARARRVWQVPTLVLAAGLLGTGIVGAVLTKPQLDPEVPLKEAEQLFEAGDVAGTISGLNERVLPLAERGLYTTPQEARMHLLRARAVSAAQAEADASGAGSPENDRTVLKEFEAARARGGVLDGDDQVRIIEAHLGLGAIDAAADALSKLDAERTADRRRLTRKIVERVLSTPRPGPGELERALALLATIAQDAGTSPDGRAWALWRMSDLRLAGGESEGVIDTLLRQSPALLAQAPRWRGRLLATLGRAYLAVGDTGAAERQLSLAMELLDQGDDARPDAIIALARISESQGQLEDAHDLYTALVEQHPESAWVGAAQFGLARVEAGQGNDELAAPMFAEIVAQAKSGRWRDVDVPGVEAALMALYSDRTSTRMTSRALTYAELAQTLHRDADTPGPVLLAIAESNLTLADSVLEEARAQAPGARSAEELPESQRLRAKAHLLSAAAAFRRHAKTVQGSDPLASTRSLWLAAECADRGGDLDEAISAFSEYAAGAGDDDPRKPEAIFRVAQARRAKRDYDGAAALFRELVDGRQSAGGVGPWGDQAVVPLALMLLRDANLENDQTALTLLEEILGGRTVSPRSEDFQDALAALARAHYQGERHDDAIVRFTELLERYPDDPRARAWSFMLADSYRLSARALDEQLEGTMPGAERQELLLKRDERLTQAEGLFERARVALEGVSPERRTPLERLWLRNAYFYLGDVAFDRGDDELAIRRYDAARQFYREDPASLIAITQIVSAYARRGDWERAANAHERAKEQLARIPAEAWSDPDLPMDRRHWERWLETTAELELRGGAGGQSERVDATRPGGSPSGRE